MEILGCKVTYIICFSQSCVSSNDVLDFCEFMGRFHHIQQILHIHILQSEAHPQMSVSLQTVTISLSQPDGDTKSASQCFDIHAVVSMLWYPCCDIVVLETGELNDSELCRKWTRY